MTTRSLIRTDYVERWHLYVDNRAAKFDGYKIEFDVLGPVFVLPNVQPPRTDLWQDALWSLRFLRSQSQLSLFPPTVFLPFGHITAVDSAQVGKDVDWRNDTIVSRIHDPEPYKPSDDHTSHGERVRALCRMLDMCVEAERGAPN